MKKIYGFAALSAAMLLASCSNEGQEPNMDPTNSSLETCYIAVNLAAPGDETRADNDDNALPGESTVKDFKLVVFDQNNDVILTTPALTIDSEWVNGTGEVSLKTKEPKIVTVNKVADQTISGIICIANAPANLTYTTSDNLEKVRKDLLNKCYIEEGSTKYFTMTNAAIVNTTAEGTPASYMAVPTADNIATSPTAAKSKPINIYIERVAARVDAVQKDSFDTSKAADECTDENGNSIKLHVVLTGMDFYKTPENANLVKNIDSFAGSSYISTIPFTGWNESLRSHWGENCNDPNCLSLFFSTATPVDASGSELAANAYRKASSHKFEVGTTSKYLQEFMPNGDNLTVADKTAIILTGYIAKEGENTPYTDGIYQLWQDGNYYTKNGALTNLADYLTAEGYVWKKTENGTTTTTSVSATDLDLQDGYENYDAYVKINAKSDYTLYKGSEATTPAAVNAAIKSTAKASANSTYRVYVYGNSNTYFYATIQGEDNGTKMPAGLVRNHIYEINMVGIGGLGNPKREPNTEIIPTPIDKTNEGGDKSYFATTINIIKWKAYTQSVNFGTQTN